LDLKNTGLAVLYNPGIRKIRKTEMKSRYEGQAKIDAVSKT
jgi:hypothetical protein